MTAAALLAAWHHYATVRSPVSCSNGVRHGEHFLTFSPQREFANGVLHVQCLLDNHPVGVAVFANDGRITRIPPIFAEAGFPTDAFNYHSALAIREARLNAAFTTGDIES